MDRIVKTIYLVALVSHYHCQSCRKEALLAWAEKLIKGQNNGRFSKNDL